MNSLSIFAGPINITLGDVLVALVFIFLIFLAIVTVVSMVLFATTDLATTFIKKPHHRKTIIKAIAASVGILVFIFVLTLIAGSLPDSI